MIFLILFTEVGTISSFSFFAPESERENKSERKREISVKSGDPPYSDKSLEFYDSTDVLQAPSSNGIVTDDESTDTFETNFL